NSAAAMQRTPIGEISAEDWDHILDLNLRAPLLLSQAAAPHLRRTRGVIVNIADLSAFETWPGYIVHGVSKAGLVYLTKALARVLAPDVRVTGIAPGTVLLPEGWTDADAARQRGTTPLQRLGSPDDVTRTLLFLLDSDYITGEVLVVDGGRMVR
ncbi:MAG TPA: SDR family oxidoreductase, partial [Chloroflexota bacterium]|nr:SDR family oxidoreductase [Chloroflexota bacterium]